MTADLMESSERNLIRGLGHIVVSTCQVTLASANKSFIPIAFWTW